VVTAQTLRSLSIAAALLLAAFPTVLNALRQPTFSASAAVSAAQQPGFGPVEDRIGYVRRLMDEPEVARQTVLYAGLPIDESKLAAMVDIRPAGRPVLLLAHADSPEHARDLANTLAVVLANASTRDALRRATRALASIRVRLSREPLSPAERQALADREQQLERTTIRPFYGLAIARRAQSPHPTRIVDRALDRLPGPLPARPGLAVTALVTLSMFALIFTFCTALRNGADRDRQVCRGSRA